MKKTTVKKGLLEFQSHGNRVWHRCPKVYDAWNKPGIKEPVRVGICLMTSEDVGELVGNKNDSELRITQESLMRGCLIPMYRIGQKDRDNEHPVCFGVIPHYVCPACMVIFSIDVIKSGRTVNFGSSKKGRKEKRS